MPRISASFDELTQRITSLGGEVFGHSVQGQPLWKLSLGAATGRPVLVVAGLHALEHAGPLAALRLAERVAAGASAWGERRLVVVPLANPDGFRQVEADDAAHRRRFRRGNARGVDLNRNFAEGWDGTSWLSRSFPAVFAAGAHPLSEPETAALDRLAGEEQPSVVASLHAYGRWIYLPWASRREPPADAEAQLEAARGLSALQRDPYRVVQLARRSRFFRAHGTELDHFFARHDAWTFLFEIGRGWSVFDPRQWIDPLRWYTAPEPRLARDIADLQPALDGLATCRAGLPSR